MATAGTSSSTKQKLLSLIEDVEIISRELFELMSTPKGQQRPDAPEPSELIQLLILKDKTIKESIVTAKKQAEIQRTIDDLKREVNKRDLDIRILQKNLKEAENVLTTAIYQAKQKLSSISQANNRRISSEELIKFAHRISASNAVAAPPTWAPGDPRRPYPTDFEMRSGWLAKMSDLPLTSQTLQAQGTYGEPNRLSQMSDHQMAAPHSQPHGPQTTPPVSWQQQQQHSAMETQSHPVPTVHHPVPEVRVQTKDSEEVELMSSDSSSSSSSDE